MTNWLERLQMRTEPGNTIIKLVPVIPPRAQQRIQKSTTYLQALTDAFLPFAFFLYSELGIELETKDATSNTAPTNGAGKKVHLSYYG